MTGGPTFHYLHRPPAAGAGKAPLLLMLHGYGSNEQDLFGLAPWVDPRLAVVSLRAPTTLGRGSYAWFDLRWQANGTVQPDVVQAQQVIQQLIGWLPEVVKTLDADPARVYFGGFSQGAILSALTLLSKPAIARGAVLMSGSVPNYAPVADAPALVAKPVLLTHGTLDPVLPIHHGRGARDFLTTLGVDLAYREYRAGHTVNAEMLHDVAGWLTTQLDTP